MNRADRRNTIPSRAELEAQAKRKRTILFASLGLVAILIVVAIALASNVPKTASLAPQNAKLAVGAQAPEFQVATTGGAFDLAHAGGKPTLLEVFATWCPHCQRETAVLNAVDAKYHGRANVVAVSGSPYGMDSTTPENQADVVGFMQKYSVTYPIAFDPNLSVANAYLQGGFPTIVLIGADGKIQSITSGEVARASIDRALDASVAGKKPSPTMS